MGSQHKLLLPWGASTIIEHVLQAWCNSRVDRVVVVVRSDDALLQAACRRFDRVEVLVPATDPVDMKDSVHLGLQHLCNDAIESSDRWMIAPADLPTLSSSLIDLVIEGGRTSNQIVVPRFGDRRGHPVSFPWSLASDVGQLGGNDGINRLLERYPLHWLSLSEAFYPEDVDTEAEYRRMLQAQQASQSQ
jgi:molybdenum cofactor cytidylyltransferase